MRVFRHIKIQPDDGSSLKQDLNKGGTKHVQRIQ